ncbi:MAG: DUF1385 domain-containing protein [Chloroflexi bacterium]|nr:DUF1385 domain-containing protein [Chloroflexota bacterium]
MATFYYGGQAVIEGVLMRGRTKAAVAVRTPDGRIRVHEEPLTAPIYRSRWAQWPFLRGLTALWDALILGTKALIWSADVALEEEARAQGKESEGFSGIMAGGTVLFSLAVGIGLFFLLPSLVTKLLDTYWGDSPWVSSLVEGGVRLGLFLLYLWAIGLAADVRRVFAYHGAEHKTINAFEAGAALVPEQVAQYSRFHVRCGTSFLLFVLLVSIIIFAPFHFQNIFFRLLSRILLIPIVAMISYELIRVSAARPEHPLLRWLIVPGLLLQRLTTREPDLDMLEVAIAALVPVLVADGVPVERTTAVYSTSATPVGAGP